MTTVVWHNPDCSKSRGLMALLEERGIEPQVRLYLEIPPRIAELVALAEMLGSEDGAALLREKEPEYAELKLADADRHEALRRDPQVPEALQPPGARPPRQGGHRPPAREGARDPLVELDPLAAV